MKYTLNLRWVLEKMGIQPEDIDEAVQKIREGNARIYAVGFEDGEFLVFEDPSEVIQ